MPEKTRFLRVFDAFGLTTAVLLVLVWSYGPQVRSWYRARQLARTHPAVLLVPHPLSNTSVATEKGMTLTKFGYQFEVPWTGVEGQTTTPTVAAYLFSGGRGLSFWNPAEMATTVETIRERFEASNRRFIDFLGAKTEYDLLNSEFNVTPEQLSPFLAKSEAYRRGILLRLKGLELEAKPASEIYSFGTHGWRVFQLGDPEKDRVVEVRCFDSGDRELRLDFAVERGSNAKLSQPEINQTLDSLRVANAEPGDRNDARR